jgi:hypothetical protein
VKFEIDQSGKIEDTAKNTVLALSDDIKYTVILSAKTKRTLQSILRREGRPGMFVYLVFSSLLYLLLKSVQPKSKVIVDKEYPGKENLVKLIIKRIIQKEGAEGKLNFEFGLVGKSSNAHGLAHKTYKKKLKANKKVKFEEIIRLIYSIKNDRVSRY